MSVGFYCLNCSKRLFFFCHHFSRAFLDRARKLLGTSLIFRHYSRIFNFAITGSTVDSSVISKSEKDLTM